jgi:hypothetical protein
MAVAVEVSFPDMTLETYHQALERMGASPGGPHPESGCVFHCAWDAGGRVRVFDVWESQERFEQFMQSRLADMGEELGISPPETNVIQIDTYMTAGR